MNISFCAFITTSDDGISSFQAYHNFNTHIVTDIKFCVDLFESRYISNNPFFVRNCNHGPIG